MACYPENLQNYMYLAHAQAVDTRPSSPHTRGPGNEASPINTYKETAIPRCILHGSIYMYVHVYHAN